MSCFASSPLFPRRVCASEASDKTTRFTRRTGPTLRRIRIFSRFALPPSSRSGLFFAACPFPFFLSVSFFAWRRVLFLLWQTFFLATLFFVSWSIASLPNCFFLFVWNPRRVTFLGCSLAEVRPVRRHVSLWWLYLLADRVTLCKKKNRTKRECGGGLDPGEEWLARVDILTFPEEGTGGTSRYLGR